MNQEAILVEYWSIKMQIVPQHFMQFLRTHAGAVIREYQTVVVFIIFFDIYP